MKNKIKLILTSLILSFLFFNSFIKADDFNFDISEIEILNDGNLFKGLKRGTITTNNSSNVKAK